MYLRDFLALKPFHDYSFCSVYILPQPAFYSQSAVCILHAVCILLLVLSLQSAVRSLRFTLTDNQNTPLISYRKGKSLKHLLVRAKLWRSYYFQYDLVQESCDARRLFLTMTDWNKFISTLDAKVQNWTKLSWHHFWQRQRWRWTRDIVNLRLSFCERWKIKGKWKERKLVVNVF